GVLVGSAYATGQSPLEAPIDWPTAQTSSAATAAIPSSDPESPPVWICDHRVPSQCSISVTVGAGRGSPPSHSPLSPTAPSSPDRAAATADRRPSTTGAGVDVVQTGTHAPSVLAREGTAELSRAAITETLASAQSTASPLAAGAVTAGSPRS